MKTAVAQLERLVPDNPLSQVSVHLKDSDGFQVLEEKIVIVEIYI